MTLTKNDLARLLQVSTRTIDRLRATGCLPKPITRPPHHPRWSREVIQRWIDGGMK